MFLSLTPIDFADFPNGRIVTDDSKIVFGSKTLIKALISSYLPICGMEWQKGIDRHNFSRINIVDPRHEGSSLDPKSPLLVITKTTFEDELYYRLRVQNTIGEHFSDTLHLNVTGSMSQGFTKNLILNCVKKCTHIRCIRIE